MHTNTRNFEFGRLGVILAVGVVMYVGAVYLEGTGRSGDLAGPGQAAALADNSGLTTKKLCIMEAWQDNQAIRRAGADRCARYLPAQESTGVVLAENEAEIVRQ